MKLVMCAIFDRAVKAYQTPMFFRTTGEAVRAFMSACQDGKSVFCQNPEDYHMDCLGVWNDSDGDFESKSEKLVSAMSCVKVIAPGSVPES